MFMEHKFHENQHLIERITCKCVGSNCEVSLLKIDVSTGGAVWPQEELILDPATDRTFRKKI
jgi:hypothetical protein